MNDDYRDLFAALDAAGVEYVVVGAHALAAHGIIKNKLATGRDKDLLDVRALTSSEP